MRGVCECVLVFCLLKRNALCYESLYIGPKKDVCLPYSD